MEKERRKKKKKQKYRIHIKNGQKVGEYMWQKIPNIIPKFGES